MTYVIVIQEIILKLAIFQKDMKSVMNNSASYQPRVFVIAAHFHSSLIFAGKARNLISEYSPVGLHMGRLHPRLLILD
jgi:hypothetical protein